MTDDRMDARLHAAGAAWRAAADSAAMGAPTDEPAALVPPAPRRPRRHRTALLASAGAVAAALVAGGGFVLGRTTEGHESTEAGLSRLEGTVWRLLGYDHQQQMVNSTATFVVHGDGTFVADDECRVYSGRLDAEDGQLFPTRFGTPRDRGCTDATYPTFAEFPLLAGFPRYSVDANQLTVEGDGTTAHLQAAPELPAPTTDVPSVEGATWQLTGVTGPGGDKAAVHGKATFKIDDHHLVASDTCNTISGDVAVDDRRLTAGKGGGLAVTEMGCPPEVMDTASVVDRVLADGAAIELRGTTLTITRAGAGTLTYQWVPDDEQATDWGRVAGRTWHLASVAGEPVAGDVRLDFERDGRFTGNDGCAEFSGRAGVRAGSMSTAGVPERPPASCSGPAAGQASTVDSFLHGTDVMWAVRDQKLLIFGGGAQAFSLVFDADVPPRPAATAQPTVTGKAWRLTSIAVDSGNSGSGEASSDYGITLTLQQGRVSIDTKCGSWSGTAEVSDKTLDVSGVKWDGGDACLPEAMSKVLPVLDGTVTWSIQGGELRLTKGATTLTFEG